MGDDAADAAAHGIARLGLAVRRLTPDVATRLGFEPDQPGVVVTQVDRNGGPAERIFRGDVVLKADSTMIRAVADLAAAIAEAHTAGRGAMAIHLRSGSLQGGRASPIVRTVEVALHHSTRD